MKAEVDFVTLRLQDRELDIEYRWVGGFDRSLPLMVFLHEGLGSLAMWKEFPDEFCRAAGCRGLVYSRPGYGRSTPRAVDERWRPDFMHRQAREVLPRLLESLEIDARANPPWLFGHSDGGSIALLYAASCPDRVAGVIALSPHIMVEDISIESISKTRGYYLEADLKEKLARYHDDPDSAFWGWNDIWLDPAFRAWSIEAEIGEVGCALLAVQGLEDEYGTVAQVHGIKRHAPQTEIVELPACGHSPHRDQAEALTVIATGFFNRMIAAGAGNGVLA